VTARWKNVDHGVTGFQALQFRDTEIMEHVRFMHIPKTAGTTMNDVLLREYGRGRSFVISDDIPSNIARFHALPEKKRNTIRVFLGHARIVTGLPDADDARTITFLRDPVKRVKSFCQHVSEGKSPYLVEQFPPSTFDLGEFLASGNTELSNLQTKFLIENGTGMDSGAITEMSESQARGMALDNLTRKVSCFGLQEYFEESLILFSQELGWRRMPFFGFSNRSNTRKPLEFKRRHVERIVELNTVDIELYKAAKDVFLNRVNSETFDDTKLARLRAYNRLVSKPMVMMDWATARLSRVLKGE